MRRLLLASTGALLVLTAAPASAQVYGDLATWQSDVGAFSRDTMYGSEFANIGALTLDDGTSMSFGTPVSIRQVGSSWATWSGGYTDQVLYSSGLTSLTTTFTSGGSSAFGFYVQPNPFDIFDITMTLSDGSFLTQAVSGNGGADFFGWAGPSVTSFTLSSQSDFAFGDFYSGSVSAAVPEPSTWAMLLLGFFGVGGMVRSQRRKQKLGASFA